MADSLKLVLAQLNLCVGDVRGNVARIISSAARARDELGAQLVIFPELALTGYPPEDLLLRSDLQARVAWGMEELQRALSGIDVVVGYPHSESGKLYNAAAVIRNGSIVARYFKQHLPNYGVFDEKRYFEPGNAACVVEVGGVPLAITICEDLWLPQPMQQARAAGARLLININASPFHAGKGGERETLLRQRAQEGEMPIVYVNLLGGQDELVFDGGSCAVDSRGAITVHAPAFEEGLYEQTYAVSARGELSAGQGVCHAPLPELASIYQALVLGIRDYIEKNRFDGVVLGVSGGVDSALTLALAVDAIGAARVEAVQLPSRYTAQMSMEDGAAMAQALGVETHVIPIEPAFKAFTDSLQETLAGRAADVTEENIQARCRGVILMAIANKKRKMVLSTGNKSEMAVGYATLYGDMAGGFAPLKDVSKTLVYRLTQYRNSIQAVIPQRVLERPPSAELAPNQKDADSLPPYDVLDPILERYVEQEQRLEEIVAAGYDEATVRRVLAMVDRNEYKRRQAAPGVRITQRAFGRDRRYPITWAAI